MNDEQLRTAFAELRRVEAAHVPPWGAAALRGGRPRPYLRFAFALLLLIALAVVMIPRRPPQPALSAWRAPTDFLLQTPGRELLHSVPDLKGTRQ